MSHAQPDPGSDPVVQHFLQHLEAHKSKGIRATVSSAEDGYIEPEPLFVTPQALEDYFAETDVGERLVGAALKGAGRDIRAKDILKNHLVTFTILVRIGKGEFVPLFLRRPRHLSDKQLPFHSEPAAWPIGVPFDAFAREQWHFCPYNFEHLHNIEIETECILPIECCEEIGRGGSAIAYRVKINPQYDSLCDDDEEGESISGFAAEHTRRDSSPSLSSSRAPPKTYVLKTYNTEDARSYYENEIVAFDRLQLTGQPCSNIIGYHGSFTKGETYNVLLEYADYDTLDNYLEKYEPPAGGQDILDFWQNMFGLIQGLRCIHDVEINHVDGPSIFQGWHQDIKPSNILVCSRGKESPYKCDFKLADLGLSHFLESQGQVAVADVDSNGTRAYGAPECYRDKFTESTKLKVRQRVDVWSLGCVFSEVAVWLVLGKAALAQYRLLRRRETATIHNFHDHGCFHDSKRVLTSVVDQHEKVSHSVRSCDFVTRSLVGVKRTNDTTAMPGMIKPLLSEADARPDAAQLWHQANDILEEAKLALDEWQANLSRRSVTLPSKKSPPVLPPGLPHSMSDPTFGGLQTDQLHLGPPFEVTRRHEQRPTSAESELYNITTTSTGTPTSHKTPATSPQSTDHRIRPHRLFGHPETSPDDIALDPDTPSRRTGGPRTHGRGNSGVDHIGLGIGGQPSMSLETREQVPPFSTPQAYQSHVVMSHPASRKPSQPLVKLSVEELLEYLPNRKDPYRQSQLKGKWFLDDLVGRDYVFLVDDAVSMRPHWDEVERLFMALGGLLKDYDKNGIDVHFTKSEVKQTFRHRAAIKSTLRNSKPKVDAGTCDITKSLSAILHKYRENFETKKQWRQSAVGAMVKSLISETKPLTLFVLTDAVWQPKSDPASAIRGMVEFLLKHDIDAHQVGIQFIRFGYDPDLKERLDRLDSKLGLDPDIVDAEPFDGNVWKMLLGSTNKSFDDDEDVIPMSPQGRWSTPGSI